MYISKTASFDVNLMIFLGSLVGMSVIHTPMYRFAKCQREMLSGPKSREEEGEYGAQATWRRVGTPQEGY